MKRLFFLLLPLVINLNSDHHIIPDHQLIIIGSGPAGLTAAIYAGRAKLSPLVIEGAPSMLTTVSTIENWPCHERISGEELIESMIKHAKTTGATFTTDYVTELFLNERPFIIKTANGSILTTQALIIATGMCPKKIGCPGEKEYFGKGVANCAHCDAPLFENSTVAIVGGGMMALQNATILKKYAKKIFIFNDKRKFSGPSEMISQVTSNPMIEIKNNCEVRQIGGDKNQVTFVEIYNKEAKAAQQFKIDGIFISIGYEPCNQLIKNILKTDNEGRIKTNALGHTEIPGVFVAGNAATIPHGQAIICASSGCIAAIEAEKFLGRKPNKKGLFSCQKS